MEMRRQILLIELPTYPKGTVALSLYAVAAAFAAPWEPVIIDLNLEDLESAVLRFPVADIALIGIKVSAQNFAHAVATTQALRARYPHVPVLWGGELPTLLPDTCLQHAHTVVCGAFEPIAEQLCADLARQQLQPRYQGDSDSLLALPSPRLDLLPQPERYQQFMGWPMESSRGCTYKCTFCMVHTMQPRYLLKSEAQLAAELRAYEGRFLNLVDYNFGVDEAHVLRVAAAIQASGVLGWMGEMCLESLDNDRVLAALAASRCRMVYCGLEAVDELGLKSINKARTNHIENYERIIRKVQSHGIQIAAGMIIGLEGASLEGFERMRAFFQRMGILYIKLTFLTYNPGTKVRESMLRKGSYVTEDISHYDGNHLTFLAHGLEASMLYAGTRQFVERFYSLRAIVRRSFQTRLGLLGRLEFVLFNLCYREFYLDWMRHGVLGNETAYQARLASLLAPRWQLRWADRWLRRVRKWRKGE
jgi:radical SAM superfamily enzyme YgiQ (UPF0313 family)